MKNKEYTVYLDLDGVLVDFIGGSTNLKSGVKEINFHDPNNNPNKNISLGVYNPEKVLHFWSNLEWINGGKELFYTASKLFDKVCILSSTGSSDVTKSSIIEKGKLIWLKNNIPSIKKSNIFIVNNSKLKQEFSNKFSILVDDKDSNITQWNTQGGFGILHYSKRYEKSIESLEDIAYPTSITEIVKRFYK